MAPRNEVFEAIRAGRPSDRGPGVGLVDILERVDASEKWLLSHAELDRALRRLHEAGKIRELTPGRYVEAKDGAAGAPYRPLPADEYEQAVRQYRDEFAEDVVKVMNLPLLRHLGAGLVDHDQVSISFVLERVVARFGGTIGEPVGPQPLGYPVALPDGADLEAFATEAREALAARRLGHRETWLLLPGGGRRQIGGLD